MGNYMVLYRSSMSAGEQMAASTPEEAQAGMEGWMRWAGKVGTAIVDLGSPLATVGSVGKSSGRDGGLHIGGFSILKADSADDVKKLLDGHPHFDSPGDTAIEILEFLPIPGM
jgi:hypothetical protein